MTQADLEQLIKDWYLSHGGEKGELRLTATDNCPPLTRLWRYVAEDYPLEEYEEHVAQCERCRRLCEIMRREHTRAPAIASPVIRFRRGIYTAGGVLAAAACIALIIFNWPQPSFEPEGRVFAFAEHAFSSPSTVRGEPGEAPSAGEPQPPAWITAALAEPAVKEAVNVLVGTQPIILLEIHEGRLRIDADGRVVISDTVDEATADTRDLTGLIERDQAACEKTIDALIEHLPGATEKDRARLMQSFNRWRAREVFASDESGG